MNYKSNTIRRLYRQIPGLYGLYTSSLKKELSLEARLRLKWFDYYQRSGNVSLTCRYFGIARKTFYYWKKKYNPYNLSSLETGDFTPKHKRQRIITLDQEAKIIALRKKYIRYGKIKLASRYEEEYKEKISSWHIQKTIEKKKLYYNPKRSAQIAKKRRNSLKKKRITELKKKEVSGFLVCLDTIVIYWNGMKRYIFTAIDYTSKIAFARMYATKSSYNAADFLSRLHFLLDGKITNIAHDNGSEFMKHFTRLCSLLNISQYWSRPKTPKDNAVNERFNQTLEREFIQLSNFTTDIPKFNQKLTEWLIEYNFRRPHQTLGYIAPINFEVKYIKLLPRYPSDT